MDQILLIVVLVLGGLALLLAELVTPMFGVLATAAIACFVGAVYFCFQISPVLGIVVVVLLVVGLPVYVVVALRVLPRTRAGRRLLVQRFKAPIGEGLPEAGGYQALVGQQGLAVGPLRPSGTIEVQGRRVPAAAETGTIAAGQTVIVVRAVGMNVIVRPHEPAREPPPAKEG